MRETGSPRGAAQLAGVLLHGRGRAPEEKVDLAARLGYLDGIRWLIPAAATGSWYPNRFFDPVAANEPWLSEAVKRCHEAVEEASERGRLAPERILIAGFSQGACLALEYALRHPGRCGALVVLTGALIGPPDTDWRARVRPPGKSLDGLRVFLTGSDADDWVAQEYTHATAGVLADLGARVQLRIYKGRPHIVSDEEVVEARAFIASYLTPRPLEC